MNNSVKISDFYENEFINYASYDVSRSIASYVDGVKISARKAIYVVLTTNIGKIKVSQLGADVSKKTNYIHGETSMFGVITNLAADYCGSNNINLFTPEGNFGSRFNTSASAPRYIFVKKEKILDYLFIDDDLNILDEQIFEGDIIEPKFLVPTLPLLLINGSDGIGVGFRQFILPRNPKEIIKFIKEYLNGKELNKRIAPWFKGFKGTVVNVENNQWEIRGIIEQIKPNIVQISEVPIGYDLKSYLDILDELKDKREIISYEDMSEDDNFSFKVKLASKEILDNDTLLTKFKLIKKSSELYNSIDENLTIRSNFETELDILKAFISVKLKYIGKRKDYLLEKYEKEIKVLKNKYNYISKLNSDEIILRKKSENDVIHQLESLSFDKIDNSYDYLLNMSTRSCTTDRLSKLQESIKEILAKYKELKNLTLNEIYLRDLESISKYI